MKIFFIISMLYLSTFINDVYAQSNNEINLVIVSGSVTFTPARFGGVQEPTIVELSGSLVAFIPEGGEQLFFISSNIVTPPNVSFTLPSAPSSSDGGTVREITFTYDNGSLFVTGLVDQRAFDGPLMEYTFTALPSTNQEFDFSNLYSVRPDYRKCISPLCGGYFVKKLNYKKTLCADGTRQNECYVESANMSDFDFSAARSPAPSNTTPYIFKGEMTLKSYGELGDFGVFTATNMYQSVSDNTADGRFYMLENLGIFCITSPCFGFDAHLLNRDRILDVSGYDFSRVDADEKVVESVKQNLADGELVIFSGRVKTVEEFAGPGRHVIAKEIFTELRPQ